MDSHRLARERFDSVDRANSYPIEFGKKLRHRQEAEVALRAFRHFNAGDRILDLPCGTGRLLKPLLDMGTHVTAADVSQPMVDKARWTVENATSGKEPLSISYQVADVLNTGFPDNHFDGVVCYRLLHHFHEAPLRRQSLTELKRICRGPVIVSVFTSWALDYYIMLLKELIKGNKPLHRDYLPLKQFEEDVAATGLEIVEKIPRLRFISPFWLYVLREKA